MARKLKILAIHGVGRHQAGGDWEVRWADAIKRSLTRTDPSATSEIEFLTYDDFFDAEQITTFGTLEAIAKLAGSGLWHGIGDAVDSIFGQRPRRARSLRNVSEKLRWTAGMVIQWVENETIRVRSRERIGKSLAKSNADVICAHSLGSLIAYDTFSRKEGEKLIEGKCLVSFGSQIGNPFVRSQFAGRIEPLKCQHWYNLYNPEDDIFTAPIRVTARNFEQVDCAFDISGFADHDATEYLAHASTSDVVWSDMLSQNRLQRKHRSMRHAVRSGKIHRRRALLIGINEYPSADMRLEGCVNDTFLMSEVLQENGFDASDIRVVLNRRATADAIRERIEWLLDGIQSDGGDKRVLFFSGHGAQIPDYGADEKVDRVDECLVPWDFDWSREYAVTDDWFHNLYGQLPYNCQFLAIFDCCHSGGMTRSGLGRPRGLTPPDDIRHRQLQWDAKDKNWRARELEDSKHSSTTGRGVSKFHGAHSVNRRLGVAADLRGLESQAYKLVRKQLSHYGPYMPVLLQACQESQLAFEYRHGNNAYGAFTYTLVQELRSANLKRLTFSGLIKRTRTQLWRLGYEQVPNLDGPKAAIKRPILS